MRIVYTCPELALSVSLWSSCGKEWTERYRCDASFSTFLFSRTTLDKFRVKQWLTVLLATPDATCPEQRQAMARLAQIGRPAIPHLLPALGSTPTPTILIEFLTTRVNQASLPYFAQGLSDR